MKDLRRRHLARIHLLSKELGLSDAAYRNVLAALTGERTAKNLNETGRLRVIGVLARSASERRITA